VLGAFSGVDVCMLMCIVILYDGCVYSVLMSLVVYHIGANKIYRDQLMCTEQEPWLFRGGLLGEIQVS